MTESVEKSVAGESEVVSCRHCQRKNRVSIDRALEQPDTLRCGSCHGALLLGKDEAYVGLSGRSYQHPWDREALAALQKVPGIDSLLRWLMSESYERMVRMYHVSSFIRCHERQGKDLYRMYRDVAERLDIQEVPELFIYRGLGINAYTTGVRKPLVALSSDLLNVLDDDELRGVMAHELGHWQNDHVLYSMAAQILGSFAGSLAVSVLGLGSLAIIPLRLALLKWVRCAELTADRAELIVVRDPKVALRTMMKLAGATPRLMEQLDLDEFLAQVEHAENLEKENLLNRVFSMLQSIFKTHPLAVWRAAELMRWARSGSYVQLMAGHYLRRGDELLCDCESCQRPYPSTLERCPYCGHRAGEPYAGTGETRDKDFFSQVQEMIPDGVQDAVQQGTSWLRGLFGGDEPKGDGEEDPPKRS
ncbi:MAG: M48 family metallopeptidase [Myxococcales bacterium]|nr:M48 family metallopeptidase [Myxococcales bacterium]